MQLLWHKVANPIKIPHRTNFNIYLILIVTDCYIYLVLWILFSSCTNWKCMWLYLWCLMEIYSWQIYDNTIYIVNTATKHGGQILCPRFLQSYPYLAKQINPFFFEPFCCFGYSSKRVCLCSLNSDLFKINCLFPVLYLQWHICVPKTNSHCPFSPTRDGNGITIQQTST